MSSRARNITIAAVLSLSMTGFAIPAFSQNQPQSRDQQYRLAQAAGAAESNEADENNPRAEDREISQKIDKAR